MKNIKFAIVLLSVLYNTSATTQVLISNLKGVSLASGTPDINENVDRYSNRSYTNMATNHIRNNEENEALFDGLVKSNNKESSISYTDLTLVENSLKIHQVKNKNRLIRVNEVQFKDEVTFYNHLGYLVNTISSVTPKENSVVLNLNSLKEGIYFLKFKKHHTIKRIHVY